MNRTGLATTLMAGVFIAAAGFAQVPAGAPAGSTGACKDGTYTSAANKKGACQGHKGVKEWYGTTAATAPAPAAAKAAPAPAAAAPKAATQGAAGASGLCKDGTPTFSANKKGACQGHKGVKEWYGAAAAPVAAPAAAVAVAPPPAPPPAGVAPQAANTPPAIVAPGGGPGLVWVNKSTKVYHCLGDEWYGKTKSGAYMSEADARAQGYRPERGKTCSR